jgi:hypothetical protein
MKTAEAHNAQLTGKIDLPEKNVGSRRLTDEEKRKLMKDYFGEEPPQDVFKMGAGYPCSLFDVGQMLDMVELDGERRTCDGMRTLPSEEEAIILQEIANAHITFGYCMSTDGIKAIINKWNEMKRGNDT